MKNYKRRKLRDHDKEAVEHNMDRISNLPDCVLSSIISKFSMKDLFKTSVLSRRWQKLGALRHDLNFDVPNMIGSEKQMLEAGYLFEEKETNYNYKRPVLDKSRPEFVQRVDQFMNYFQGTKIDLFRVALDLNYEHSSSIDKWISFAIARRVERIELLFSGKPYYACGCSLEKEHKRYKFPFTFFSESDASLTLKHMHLQRCLLSPPANFDFVPFRNLRSLILEDATVGETLMRCLLSRCILLEDLSLINCHFTSILKIGSSSLRHLNVHFCHIRSKFVISALNLTSMELLACKFETFSIHAPLLKSIYYFTPKWDQIPQALTSLSRLPQLDILDLDTINPMDKIFMVNSSLIGIGQFVNLKQLYLSVLAEDIEDCGFDIVWILTILRAIPHLQKLSFTITYPTVILDQTGSKDFGGILSPSKELKVIEMGGCVGNWYEIELVLCLLKYVDTLEQIVLSPFWTSKEFNGEWNSDPAWFQHGRERFREKLQDEVAGRAQLKLL